MTPHVVKTCDSKEHAKRVASVVRAHGYNASIKQIIVEQKVKPGFKPPRYAVYQVLQGAKKK